ncbi:unnamed protein product [Cylindrotheca closterium]|uniref:G-protein coupled receptors family 3 profile domain-containing protein n=1 Tax=Cylindrotheca closterium TaxID=2856 RepID=A0AAD2G7P6_9STRA|nr:unnamed protein product [Cylindrotheca closterium]
MASILTRTVHFVVGGATLLSGGLLDCPTPFHASCEAGISNLDALMRNFTADEPALLLPFIDRNSPFVQMHPLSWAVNRLVYQGMLGLEVFSTAPLLLQQHKVDGISSRDLSALQTSEFPFLLSNVAVSPGNSWSAYQIPLYLDEETGLAVMSIFNDDELYTVDQVEAAIGLLNNIERMNRQSGCYGEDSGQYLYDSYFNDNNTAADNETKCWIPVIVFSDIRAIFEEWLKVVANHDHPPALVVDIKEKIEKYAEPTLVDGVWVVSYEISNSQYNQLTLQIADGGLAVDNVELVVVDMETIPDELKDESYVRLQTFLSQLAREAAGNDPVLGQSIEVPVQRSGTYRRCKAGSCETGNLYTDAIRWYTKSDIAFQGSGGFRGSGWAAGGVQVSDLWGALPFDNDVCTGVISGANMFQLFNHSVFKATFEGEDTENGGLLLQVSGMRLSYNLELPDASRIVKMEIWNEETDTYSDVEPQKLYSFASDSYICFSEDLYPVFLGEASLHRPGEIPGFVGDTPIIQSVAADYLAQFQDKPYDPYIPGSRLVNRTDILEPLNFIQTADDCLPDEYWEVNNSTCAPCPSEPSAAFLSERAEFDAKDNLYVDIKLVNVALSSIAVTVKALPSYVAIESVTNEAGNTTKFSIFQKSIGMLPGETLTLNVTVDFDALEPGTAQGSVAFGVIDGGSFPKCTGRDATFEVFARKYPSEQLNQLGSLRYVGFALAAIACVLALAATLWVFMFREKHVVKVMQPNFLCMISIGVFILALAIVPASIDDQILSEEAAGMACMSVPWLLSIGFTISMSALFSKLWRIHRLFAATRRGRRVQLKEKDVIAPFALMFLFNFSVVLAWTIWAPLKFERVIVVDEPWNSYGNCQSEDEQLGNILTAVAFLVNAGPLVAAAYMAYQVRNVSDEFSEAKRVGLALFMWVQLFLVAGPMYFLIKSDNPSGRYFLEIGSMFVISVSMLSLIFVPIVWSKQKHSMMYSRRNLGEENNESSVADESKVSHVASGLGSTGSEHQGSQQYNRENRLEQYSLRDKGPKVTGVHWSPTPANAREEPKSNYSLK